MGADSQWTDHVPWWLVPILSGVPGAIAAAIVFFDKRAARHAADVRERDKTDLREQELDAEERKQLSAGQSALFDRQRQENADLREEIRFLRADRDRGWDLARAWEGMAHQIAYRANALVYMVNPQRERDGQPALPTITELPGLEDMPTRTLLIAKKKE